MDVRFTPNVSTTALSPAVARAARGAAGAVGETGFSQALQGALKSTSAHQSKADALQREVQLENPNVSIEQTMVAIQKAQIAFQATLHVRNRFVQAYTDIMNMQV